MRAEFSLIFVVLGLLQLHASAQLTKEQQKVLEDFEQYMRSNDANERRSQVEALAFVDGVEATRLLLEIGLIDDDPRVRHRAAWALSRKEDKNAKILMHTDGLRSKNELIREGTARAIGKMDDPLDIALQEALQNERKTAPRIAMLQALAAHHSIFGTEIAAKLVGDRDLGVVLAAIDMLGAADAEPEHAVLHAALANRDWRVQAAALEALGKIRVVESVPVVIDFMANTKGRLLGDARTCLMAITGCQFGFKAEQWQTWWDRVKDGWEVPDVVITETVEENDAYGREDTTQTYDRIQTKSQRMLFILDLSTSMGQSIRFRPRGRRSSAGQTWRTVERMELAREELTKYIERLDKDTYFNIVIFDAEVDAFKPKLVRATGGSIGEAKKWIGDLKPYDGGPGNFTKEGYERGETNVFAALKWIYGFRDQGLDFTGKLKPVADTVFLLADGAPTCGELTVTEEILAQLDRYNHASRVVIHTISYDLVGIGRQFLVDVARKTGGTFVELGNER
ncbi:MAG: HEAT repeat domain-containing protein [Planctomycetes bacterium]|nr:HEAT repeat domain-containing protein [Planctomycetota bacterium]